MSHRAVAGFALRPTITEEEEDAFYFESFENEEDAEVDLIINHEASADCPRPEDWDDVEISKNNTKFTIDQSKMEQWKMAKEEIKHVRSRFSLLSGKNEEDIGYNDVLQFYFGVESQFARLLQGELEIDKVTYLKFMHTICIQAAYAQTPAQLFNEKALLLKDLLIEKEAYVELWKKLSLAGRMESSSYVGEGRHEKYVWEKMEDLANEIFREVTIASRTGTISISLDDDKVWCFMSQSTRFDTFGLKYTTHVKPNRKGIVAHSAITSATGLPLSLQFERKRDSAVSCFKRILNFLFSRTGGSDGVPDLRNVIVASDRGYMVPVLVFQFLIAHGGLFVGTTKRLLQGWPFTFNQKMKDGDKRQSIDMKGAPTLAVKKICKQNHTVFATAFRNGSGKVNTTISCIHRNHHWEGVALYPREEKLYYSRESTARAEMMDKALARVAQIGPASDVDDQDKINFVRDQVVKVLTLRQSKLHILKKANVFFFY